MAVGQYFKRGFGDKRDSGDTTVEDHLRQIAKIFDGYDAHHDEFLVQSELNTKFAEYNGFDLYQKSFLRLAVGYAVREMIAPENVMRTNDYSPDPSQCRNALRRILTAASSHPELMQGISTELSKMAKDVRSDNVACSYKTDFLYKIFGFEELGKYTALSSGVSEYVLAILDHTDDIAMQCFADIVGQLNGTPYLSLVQEGHINSYLDHGIIGYGTDDGRSASGLWKLKAIPSIWQKIEEFSGDFFFAHAPEVAAATDYDQWIGARNYFLDYDGDHACMKVEFNMVAESESQNLIDVSWIHEYLKDNARLEKSYILINHALGVLNGTRDGATTLSAAWTAHQRKHLIPLMEADVQEMVDEFGRRGLAVPTMPDIKPVAGQGHLARFSLAGYNSFRP